MQPVSRMVWGVQRRATSKPGAGNRSPTFQSDHERCRSWRCSTYTGPRLHPSPPITLTLPGTEGRGGLWEA